ncbi:hypothetical protein BC834DRAFT_143001 [Gloeopeniophorella convolvens]|nr:hypothetical protein BC834DRAFT_143001 [Gloeopeniophorella convolvens]
MICSTPYHTPPIHNLHTHLLTPSAGRRPSLQSRTMSNATPLQTVSGFDTSAVVYSGTWVVDAQRQHSATNDANSTNPARVSFTFHGTQAIVFGSADFGGAALLGTVTGTGAGGTQNLPISQTAPRDATTITSADDLACGTYNLTLALGAQQALQIAQFTFAPCLEDGATAVASPVGSDAGAGGAGAGNETGVDSGADAGTDPGSGSPGREHFGALDVGLVVLAAVSVLALFVMAAILLRERRRRRRPCEAGPAGVSPAKAPPTAESHELERGLQLVARPFRISTSLRVPAPARVGSAAATPRRSPVLDISLEHRAASSAGAATRYSRSTVELPLLPPPVTVKSKPEKSRKRR